MFEINFPLRKIIFLSKVNLLLNFLVAFINTFNIKYCKSIVNLPISPSFNKNLSEQLLGLFLKTSLGKIVIVIVFVFISIWDNYRFSNKNTVKENLQKKMESTRFFSLYSNCIFSCSFSFKMYLFLYFSLKMYLFL